MAGHHPGQNSVRGAQGVFRLPDAGGAAATRPGCRRACRFSASRIRASSRSKEPLRAAMPAEPRDPTGLLMAALPAERAALCEERRAGVVRVPMAGYGSYGEFKGNLARKILEGTGYSGGEDRPLLGTDIALNAVVRYKLSRLLARDPVTSPPRTPFTSCEAKAGPAELDEEVRERGRQGRREASDLPVLDRYGGRDGPDGGPGLRTACRQARRCGAYHPGGSRLPALHADAARQGRNLTAGRAGLVLNRLQGPADTHASAAPAAACRAPRRLPGDGSGGTASQGQRDERGPDAADRREDPAFAHA